MTESGDPQKGLDQRALEIQKETLGESHPDTATTIHNFGLFYCEMEAYAKATKHYQKALEIQKACLGEEHTETITTFHNIGCALYMQRKFHDALEAFETALKTRASVSASNDDDAADTRRWIAGLRRDLRRDKRAT